jgi:hypothetical protein
MTLSRRLNILKVDILILRVLNNLMKEQKHTLEITHTFKDLDDIGNPKILIVGN